MITKHPIYPQRVRRTPRQFSWIDHRLVRDRYIESCSHPAAALYLFLVTVADWQGLSYYSEPSLMKRLSMDPSTFEQARENLIRIGLIAYAKPIYQVLALDAAAPLNAQPKDRHPMDQPIALGQLFKQMMGESS